MKTRLLFLTVVVALFVSAVSLTARAQMSETEKKAAARAAYQEGVKLQDDGKAADALARFESAQKLFDAPTHLLHIAECQALTGRLVEASETYETLARKSLPPGSPDAFTQAQQQGQAELPALRARIPTLRVTVKPGPQQVQNLHVNVNGVSMPNELLGIARPLNPGTYRFSAQAVGWATASSVDVPLAEKEQKSIELTLVQKAGGAAAVVVPPPAPATTTTPAPAPAPAPYTNETEAPKPKPGPTSMGLVFGVRGGIIIPGGEFSKDGAAGRTLDMNEFAKLGGGGGIDVYLRLVRMLLLGATFEYGSLGPGTPSVSGAAPLTVSSVSTTYIGVNLGILPNVDRVSFIGDIGIGSRAISATFQQGGVTSEQSAKGLEYTIGAGISIPVGPIRLVPRLNLGLGSFSSVDDKRGGPQTASGDIPSSNRQTHAFVFLGLAGYYSLDFGKKPE